MWPTAEEHYRVYNELKYCVGVTYRLGPWAFYRRLIDTTATVLTITRADKYSLFVVASIGDDCTIKKCKYEGKEVVFNLFDGLSLDEMTLIVFKGGGAYSQFQRDILCMKKSKSKSKCIDSKVLLSYKLSNGPRVLIITSVYRATMKLYSKSSCNRPIGLSKLRKTFSCPIEMR